MCDEVAVLSTMTLADASRISKFEIPFPTAPSHMTWSSSPKENCGRVCRWYHRSYIASSLLRIGVESFGQTCRHCRRRQKIGPGRPLRGLLLARGGPMPVELRHGERIETMLTIISSRHVEYTATALLRVDRMMKPRKEGARKINLYDQPISDVIPHAPARVDPDIADDFGIRSATSGSGRSDLTEDPRS